MKSILYILMGVISYISFSPAFAEIKPKESEIEIGPKQFRQESQFGPENKSEYENKSFMIKSFLKSMNQVTELNKMGKNCRTVCWPCCYAPRGCEVVCD